MRNLRFVLVVTFAAALAGAAVGAQELSPEEEAARKAADPLGNVRAIMTDNTIAFDAGPEEDLTNYGFQLQPVYAIPGDRMNVIARAVVPIVGIEPDSVAPPLGGGPRPDAGSQWGLSDSIAQLFFSPKSDGAWKWGLGPQVSIPTHTNTRLQGPGWGGGLAGVIFGGGGNWSIGAIAMQHWGADGDFSLMTVQPIVMYMLSGGAYIGYNNGVTYDWKAAESSNALTVPLGLTYGKTLVLESGDFIDLSIGGYPLVERPDGAPSWQLKLGFSYFFN